MSNSVSGQVRNRVPTSVGVPSAHQPVTGAAGGGGGLRGTGRAGSYRWTLMPERRQATSPTWERACEMWMEGPGRWAGAPKSGRASPPGTGVGRPPGGSGSWPPHAGLPAYSRARPGESCRQHWEGCSPFWGLRLYPRRACCDWTTFG